MKKLLAIFALVLAGLVSCGKGDGYLAKTLFIFDKTKDVFVHVNILFKIAEDTGPTVTSETRKFHLHAYMQGAEDTVEVPIGFPGSAAETGLLVSLEDVKKDFDAFLQVPTELLSTDGYSFRFELVSADTTLTDSDSNSLAALRSGILPGKAPTDNPVDLSLITTLSYELVRDVVAGDFSTTALDTYKQLLSVLETTLTEVEQSARTDVTTDLNTYSSAIKNGLLYKIINDQTLQGQVVSALQPTSDSKTSSKAEIAENLANKFTETLKTYSKDVKSTLGTSTTEQYKIFKDNIIDTNVSSKIDSGTSIVFTPAGIAFTDTDGSINIGGTVTVTKPAVTGGITGYAIYFGGSDKSKSKVQLAGKIDATTNSLTLTIAAGTALPDGSTYFWVYPLVNTTEIDVPASVLITNLINTLGYTVTSSGQNLTITPSAAQTVNAGEKVTLEVIPASGYSISATVTGTCPAGSWEAAFTSASRVYTTGAIIASCTVIFAATATSQSHSVTPSITNGTVDPSTVQTVQHGATKRFEVTYNASYNKGSVSGTCPAGSWDPELTMNVGGATTTLGYTTGAIVADCTVVFAPTPVTYTVTPSGTNLTLSPNTAQTVNLNATTSFTVTPASGYRVSTTVTGTCPAGSWSGVLTPSSDVYTTGAISSNCTVIFSAVQTHTVTTTGSSNVSINYTSRTVDHNSITTFTVTPNSGMTLNYTNVTVTGGCDGDWPAFKQSLISGGTTYTTGSVTADCNIVFRAGYTIRSNDSTNVTVSPSGTQYVSAGDTPSFTVTADSGYDLTTNQTGTCTGSWSSPPFSPLMSGDTYTLDPVNASCTLIFSATAPCLKEGYISTICALEDDSEYAKEDLVFNLDATRAKNSTDAYVEGGCEDDQLSWFDGVTKNEPAALAEFNDCNAHKGWTGKGSKMDPFKLTFIGKANTHVVVPDNGKMHPEELSLVTWINIPEKSENGAIMTKSDERNGWGLRLNNKHYEFLLWKHQLRYSLLSKDPIKPGLQQVVASYDGHVQRIYVNGVLQAELHLNDIGELPSNTNPVIIGRNSDEADASLGFTGSISAARLYKRALTAREVSELCSRAQGKYSVVCAK